MKEKNLLSDLRVLSGAVLIDDLASADFKRRSTEPRCKWPGSIRCATCFRWQNAELFGPHFFHKNESRKGSLQHGKTSTTLDPKKNGGWKIPSGSYLFVLPNHKKIPVHSEILSHFLRSMPLAFT